MKIGVSSYSFEKYIKSEKCDYFKICSLAKEMGFEAIEFVDLDFNGFNITTDPFKTAGEIRDYCKEIGLEITAYTVWANLLKEDIDSEVNRIFKCIDVAKELGAPLLRHDICWSLEDGISYDEAEKKVIPYVLKITQYAEKLGIRTCSENHGHIFQHPDRLNSMVSKVNHKNYGILCDIGNFMCNDLNSVECVKKVSNNIFHVHFKDFLYKNKDTAKPVGFSDTLNGNYIRGTVLGHGAVDVVKCLEILKEVNYNGYISLEFEGMEQTLPAIENGLKYLKSIL